MSKPDQPVPPQSPPPKTEPAAESKAVGSKAGGKPKPEFGGPAGPEPTRYGDWEKNGRCSDF